MALRESALFSREVIAEIQRAAREGVYDIRGFGAKRRLPHFDDLLLLGASMSRYPLEGYRERCDTNVVLGTRHAKRPLELDIPITIAGMSFGALSAPAKEALGRGASAMGTVDDDRRRRHDARGARGVEDARLPAAALALRDEPRRPAARRRDRDRGRAGRQARRRRHPARPEDLRSRGGDARPAAGHRSAQRLPSPRLDRARRPADQDRGAARDHRLGEADLRQDRRVAHLLRRRAGGQGGRRRHRARRHAGRDRGHPGRLHRARRHPDAAGRAPGRGRAAGAGDASPHPARRLRRDPLGRRRRQGARARGRRRLDRRGGAHRPGRQLAGVRRRLRGASAAQRASTTTGRTGATPSGSPRRTTSSPRASIPSSEVAGWRTTCARWSSRPRPWLAPAASRTSRTSSRRISWRSPSRRRPWPACRSRARPGSREHPTDSAPQAR